METVPIDSDKLVVLKFDGDFEHQGFRVTLEIGLDGHRPRVEEFGSLPAAPHLEAHLTEFKRLYRKLGGLTRVIRPQLVLSQETPRSRLNQCRQKGEELAEAFLAWLNSDSFQPLDRRLREELSRQDRIRVLVRSQNPTIQQLPWHRWDFIDRYPNSEVVFGAFSAEIPNHSPPNPKPIIHILAIFGNGSGLDLDTDRQILESILNAEITALVEPSRAEFKRALWQRSWDILFFAGHSRTDQSIGQLFLSPNEALSLDELTYSLREGVRKGLKLAIFNSCDGLGLAYALQQINLPQIIVMRELVPDQLAHEFLQTFLVEFSAGHALHLAQRRAREQLEDWEEKIPHASWLPVVVQNPAAGALSWQQFLDPNLSQDVEVTPQPLKSILSNGRKSNLRWNWQTSIKYILIAFLVTCLVVGIRSSGLLQISELKGYDRFTQLRPRAGVDERLLVITIDEEDIDYQDSQQMDRDGWSLSDEALEKLLRTILPYKPAVIGIDMAHPHTYSDSLAKIIQQNKNIVGTCEILNADSTSDTNKPPPDMDKTQLGFADFAQDPDGAIRRNILLMPSDQICSPIEALNLKLVQKYLLSNGLLAKEEDFWNLQNNNESLQIGEVSIPRFKFNSGGYQLRPISEANGFQIILNPKYSTPIPVPLRNFLKSSLDPNLDNLRRLLENRIVLLGGDLKRQDRHLTMLYSTEKVPGIVIHAHMVSQLLNIALKSEGLMNWFPVWLEAIWIFSWTLIAIICCSFCSTKLRLGLGFFTIVTAIHIVCLVLFCLNVWVPLVPTVLAATISTIAIVFLPQDPTSIWRRRT